MTEEKELMAILEENGYIAIRHIPGRGLCALHRLLFTVGIVYGLDETSYEGRYCYENWYEAVTAFAEWSGDGDPSGPWIVNKARRLRDRHNPDRVKHE
jgi:hypothetical protein